MQQLAQLTKQSEEVIRQRTLELVEIAGEAMGNSGPMVAMGMPIITMAVKKMPIQKLHSLLRCLNGISQAVLHLDYSQEQYENAVEPYVRELSQP